MLRGKVQWAAKSLPVRLMSAERSAPQVGGAETGETEMLKSIAAAIVATAVLTTPAVADLSRAFGRASTHEVKVGSSDMLPPPGYKERWWTAPNNCEYSRAGRPGETVWFLIVNTAHRKCEVYLVERGFSDAY